MANYPASSNVMIYMKGAKKDKLGSRILCMVGLLCISLSFSFAQSSTTNLTRHQNQLPLLLPSAAPTVKISSYLHQPLALSTTTSADTAPNLYSVFQPKLGQNNQADGKPWGYCPDDLAFFCRLEVKLEKATAMPVRFRLGSTQYVDYLEGKFEGWRYGY